MYDTFYSSLYVFLDFIREEFSHMSMHVDAFREKVDIMRVFKYTMIPIQYKYFTDEYKRDILACDIKFFFHNTKNVDDSFKDILRDIRCMYSKCSIKQKATIWYHIQNLMYLVE